jgi:hypothetical protein
MESLVFDGSNWFSHGFQVLMVLCLSIIRFNGDLFIAGVFDSIGITPIRAPIAKWGGN